MPVPVLSRVCSSYDRPFQYKRNNPMDPRLLNIVSDSALALLRRATTMTSCTNSELRSRSPGFDDGGRASVYGDGESGSGTIPIIVVTPGVAVALQKLSLDLEAWAAGGWWIILLQLRKPRRRLTSIL